MTASTKCRRASAVLLLLGALVVAGCSIPSDGSAQRIDASLLPQLGPSGVSDCPDLGDANAVETPLYFVTGQEETRILAPIERPVDRPVTARDALERLLKCPPDSTEQQSGYTTQIPVTSVEGFVEIEPGLYEIQLTDLQTREGEDVDELNKLAIAQIVYTVTNPDFSEPVRGVRFRIGGEPKASNTDGATKGPDEWVMRSDFTVTQPTTTTTSTTTTTTTTTEPPPPTTTAG